MEPLNKSTLHFPKPKLYIRLGYALIFFVLLGSGGWAYFAKIDSAIIANGIIAVETNRKTVQHLEGGIVDEIFVQEGDYGYNRYGPDPKMQDY